MKRLIALTLCCLYVGASAQHAGWLTNLDLAKALAHENNKLILVDFWATWCGPCKMMDADVWNTGEAAKIKTRFIPVKIDIDMEKALASNYNVRAIPMLILMDFNGEIIHTYNGYKGKEDLIRFISNIPENATDLYKTLPSGTDSDDIADLETARALGLAMQQLSLETSYSPLQRSFLGESDKWFKKSGKLAKDEVELAEIELLSVLNKVYWSSNGKKAIKELNETSARYENTPNESLLYYVFAQAYKRNEDTANYEVYLGKLKAREDGERYVSKL